MELSQVVAAAVEERRGELELLVRQLVDRELQRVAGELVEADLASRRNGTDDANNPPPDVPATEPVKTCIRCGETKAMPRFPQDNRTVDGRRNVCRECRRHRERELHPEPDEEPAPAKVRRNPNDLVATAYVESSDRERRRELLAELRTNGVDTELRGDRVFRVLHLPAFAPDPLPASARVQVRSPRGSVIASTRGRVRPRTCPRR